MKINCGGSAAVARADPSELLCHRRFKPLDQSIEYVFDCIEQAIELCAHRLLSHLAGGHSREPMRGGSRALGHERWLKR